MTVVRELFAIAEHFLFIMAATTRIILQATAAYVEVSFNISNCRSANPSIIYIWQVQPNEILLIGLFSLVHFSPMNDKHLNGSARLQPSLGYFLSKLCA